MIQKILDLSWIMCFFIGVFRCVILGLCLEIQLAFLLFGRALSIDPA